MHLYPTDRAELGLKRRGPSRTRTYTQGAVCQSQSKIPGNGMRLCRALPTGLSHVPACRQCHPFSPSVPDATVLVTPSCKSPIVEPYISSCSWTLNSFFRSPFRSHRAAQDKIMWAEQRGPTDWLPYPLSKPWIPQPLHMGRNAMSVGAGDQRAFVSGLGWRREELLRSRRERNFS